MGQFSTDTIETLDDWNALLSNGCCCPMPNCPVPMLECESENADVAHDLYVPFGDPGEGPIPRLYETATYTTNTYYAGEGRILYQAELANTQEESLTITTFTEDGGGVGTDISSSYQSYSYNLTTFACGPGTDITGDFNEAGPAYDPVSNERTCTETVTELKVVDNASSGGAPLTANGCPGPFFPLGNPAPQQEWYDIDRINYERWTLSDPMTQDDIVNEVIGLIGTFSGSGSDSDRGSLCDSSTTIRHNLFQLNDGWPTKESVVDYEDWASCGGETIIIPVWAYATQVRYRWVIDAQIVAESASSDSDGLEDWWKGVYFKVTWDVIFEPDGWDATTSDSDSIDSNDPIDPDAPHRYFVADDLTWVWTGPGDPFDEDSWKSPWFDLTPPTIPGVKRIVNVRYECYRSPYGSKPELTGEGVDPTPPSLDKSRQKNLFYQPLL